MQGRPAAQEVDLKEISLSLVDPARDELLNLARAYDAAKGISVDTQELVRMVEDDRGMDYESDITIALSGGNTDLILALIKRGHGINFAGYLKNVSDGSLGIEVANALIACGDLCAVAAYPEKFAKLEGVLEKMVSLILDNKTGGKRYVPQVLPNLFKNADKFSGWTMEIIDKIMDAPGSAGLAYLAANVDKLFEVLPKKEWPAKLARKLISPRKRMFILATNIGKFPAASLEPDVVDALYASHFHRILADNPDKIASFDGDTKKKLVARGDGSRLAANASKIPGLPYFSF